jgi:hypothetical protein
MDIGAIIQGVELADVALTALAGSAAVSEALPFMKKVKANSTLQLCFNILKAAVNIFKNSKSKAAT